MSRPDCFLNLKYGYVKTHHKLSSHEIDYGIGTQLKILTFGIKT